MALAFARALMLIISFTSVKLVGLFVTALVGLYTIEDLWDKFGDLKMSWVSKLLMFRSKQIFTSFYYSA